MYTGSNPDVITSQGVHQIGKDITSSVRTIYVSGNASGASIELKYSSGAGLVPYDIDLLESGKQYEARVGAGIALYVEVALADPEDLVIKVAAIK